MKKFLSLFVLLLCVLTVNAQKFQKKGAFPNVIANNHRMAKAPGAANRVMSRIAIEQGERLLGYYVGEDRSTDDYALGFTNYPGKTFQVGCIFNEDMVKPFAGGQVTKVRFALWDKVGESRVCVYKCIGTSAPQLITEEPLAETVIGWNDVTLSNPVTIEDNVAYLFTYEFFQSRNKYPIAVDYAVNPGGAADEGFVVYGDFEGKGASWEAMDNSGVGNILIQAVVKGGNFSDYDIAVSKMGTYGSYYAKGGEIQYQFNIKNAGNKVPESYEIKMLVDGKPVDATMTLPEVLTPIEQTIEGTLRLPADIACGTHTLSVSVEKINGVKPSADTDDDISSVDFDVYNEAFPRAKQLIEQFTSTFCSNCPLGYSVLNSLDEKRNDLAWVALHQDMSALQKDEYRIPESIDILRFSTNGYPTANINRMYIQGNTLALGIGVTENQEQYASAVSDVIDLLSDVYYPAFATVDVKSSYDKAAGKINVTVTGKKSAEDFALYVGDDAVLTVYLTEDGIHSRQLNYDQKWLEDYLHKNVLRHIATNPLGDVISWSGDTYQNDFEIAVDDKWNVDNMSVVAFISRPIVMNENTGKFSTRIDEAWVVNTNKAAVGSESTGISNAEVSTTSATEVARYTIDGRKTDRPVKGLNIVKLSDGRAVKVIVK